MAEQEPVRKAGYLRTDDPILVLGDLIRITQELIDRQAADHAAITALQQKG